MCGAKAAHNLNELNAGMKKAAAVHDNRLIDCLFVCL
jgi:hypothetical protein